MWLAAGPRVTQGHTLSSATSLRCPDSEIKDGTRGLCKREVRTLTLCNSLHAHQSPGYNRVEKECATFSVPLFDFDPQSRETAAIWRLVRNMPLHWGLPDGRIFRWWAINIPLNLLPASRFYGDIDLMICTLSTPKELPGIFYKTWEIKLMLVDKSGKPRSLKSGKTEEILTQLEIQREFGSPDVSLLEMYLHEAGSKAFEFFPQEQVFLVVEKRAKELQKRLFGYQVLPFGHRKNENGEDFVIYALTNPIQPFKAIMDILRASKTEANGAFLELAQHLSAFAESESRRLSKPLGFVVVTYCRACRRLCLIHKRDKVRCYHCHRPFTGQSHLPPVHALRFGGRKIVADKWI